MTNNVRWAFSVGDVITVVPISIEQDKFEIGDTEYHS